MDQAKTSAQEAGPSSVSPSQLAAGGYHTCGILKVNSSARCWGRQPLRKSTAPGLRGCLGADRNVQAAFRERMGADQNVHAVFREREGTSPNVQP